MYLVGVRILVGDPASEVVAPVLDDERLGKFLALAIAKAPLRLTSRDQVRYMAGQRDFQPFAYVVLNCRTRAPSSASFLNAHSVQSVNN